MSSATLLCSVSWCIGKKSQRTQRKLSEGQGCQKLRAARRSCSNLEEAELTPTGLRGRFLEEEPGKWSSPWTGRGQWVGRCEACLGKVRLPASWKLDLMKRVAQEARKWFGVSLAPKSERGPSLVENTKDLLSRGVGRSRLDCWEMGSTKLGP